VTDVTITGYENEDIIRPFTLQTGDINSPSVFDLTNYDLESNIVNQKTGASVLRLTTNESDGLIEVLDAGNGIFQMTIMHGTIPYNSKNNLRFDVIAKHKSTHLFRWLFGGPVEIQDGMTNPV
jgi:hypothetical protein